VRSALPGTLTAIVNLAALLDKVLPGDYLNLGTHLYLDRAYGGGRLLSQDTLLGLLQGGKAGSAGRAPKHAPAAPAVPGLAGLGGQISQGVGQDLLSSVLGNLLGGAR
jgi:hypothetical protein